MENKGILDVEFSEIDFDSVFLDNVGSKGKRSSRSSILKQTKFMNVDVCEAEEFDGKRKSQNAKRVSFADTFQVKELNTGNIYDIPGRNALESSKESTLSIQQSSYLLSTDKENVQPSHSARFMLTGNVEESNSKSCPFQKQAEVGKENISLSESVLLSHDIELLPRSSTPHIKENKCMEIANSHDMDMTLIQSEHDNMHLEKENCQYETCKIITSVSCITHSVHHSRLKSATSEEKCILSERSEPEIDMPLTCNYIGYENQIDHISNEKCVTENLPMIPVAKQCQKNSFRVSSDNLECPLRNSNFQNTFQSELTSDDVFELKTPNIFSACMLSKNNFNLNLGNNFQVLENDQMVNESFELNKENVPFIPLRENNFEPKRTLRHSEILQCTSDQFRKNSVLKSVTDNLLNKTKNVSEMDLTIAVASSEEVYDIYNPDFVKNNKILHNTNGMKNQQSISHMSLSDSFELNKENIPLGVNIESNSTNVEQSRYACRPYWKSKNISESTVTNKTNRNISEMELTMAVVDTKENDENFIPDCMENNDHLSRAADISLEPSVDLKHQNISQIVNNSFEFNKENISEVNATVNKTNRIISEMELTIAAIPSIPKTNLPNACSLIRTDYVRDLPSHSKIQHKSEETCIDPEDMEITCDMMLINSSCNAQNGDQQKNSGNQNINSKIDFPNVVSNCDKNTVSSRTEIFECNNMEFTCNLTNILNRPEVLTGSNIETGIKYSPIMPNAVTTVTEKENLIYNSSIKSDNNNSTSQVFSNNIVQPEILDSTSTSISKLNQTSTDIVIDNINLFSSTDILSLKEKKSEHIDTQIKNSSSFESFSQDKRDGSKEVLENVCDVDISTMGIIKHSNQTHISLEDIEIDDINPFSSSDVLSVKDKKSEYNDNQIKNSNSFESFSQDKRDGSKEVLDNVCDMDISTMGTTKHSNQIHVSLEDIEIDNINSFSSSDVLSVKEKKSEHNDTQIKNSSSFEPFSQDKRDGSKQVLKNVCDMDISSMGITKHSLLPMELTKGVIALEECENFGQNTTNNTEKINQHINNQSVHSNDSSINSLNITDSNEPKQVLENVCDMDISSMGITKHSLLPMELTSGVIALEECENFGQNTTNNTEKINQHINNQSIHLNDSSINSLNITDSNGSKQVLQNVCDMDISSIGITKHSLLPMELTSGVIALEGCENFGQNTTNNTEKINQHINQSVHLNDSSINSLNITDSNGQNGLAVQPVTMDLTNFTFNKQSQSLFDSTRDSLPSSGIQTSASNKNMILKSVCNTNVNNNSQLSNISSNLKGISSTSLCKMNESKLSSVPMIELNDKLCEVIEAKGESSIPENQKICNISLKKKVSHFASNNMDIITGFVDHCSSVNDDPCPPKRCKIEPVINQKLHSFGGEQSMGNSILTSFDMQDCSLFSGNIQHKNTPTSARNLSFKISHNLEQNLGICTSKQIEQCTEVKETIHIEGNKPLSDSANLYTEVLEKKTEYFTSQGMELTCQSILQKQYLSDNFDPSDIQSRENESITDKQNCINKKESHSNIPEMCSCENLIPISFPSQVNNCFLSDSSKSYNHKKGAMITKEQLKGIHCKTPDVVYSIRKMKKIKLNHENITNNKFLENQHVMSEFSNHNSHMTTKCLSPEPVMTNNITSSVSLKLCSQSPKKGQNCSNDVISITNSTELTTFNQSIPQNEVVINSPCKPTVNNSGACTLQSPNQNINLNERQCSVSDKLSQTKTIMDSPNKPATERSDPEEYLSPDKNIESNKPCSMSSASKSPEIAVNCSSVSLKENIDPKVHQSKNFDSSIKQFSESCASKTTEVSMNSSSCLTMENTNSNLFPSPEQTMLSSMRHSPVSCSLETSEVYSTSPLKSTDIPSEFKNVNNSCTDDHNSYGKVSSHTLENNSTIPLCDEKKDNIQNTSKTEVEVSVKELKNVNKLIIENDNYKISSGEADNFITHSCLDKTDCGSSVPEARVELSFKELKNIANDRNNSSIHIYHENKGDSKRFDKEDSKLNTSKPKFELGVKELNRSNIANDENDSSIHLCHENDSSIHLCHENDSSIHLCHENKEGSKGFNKEDSKLNTSKPNFELEFKELNRSNSTNDKNDSSIHLPHENNDYSNRFNKEDSKQNTSKPKFELKFKELNRSNIADEKDSNIHLCHENKEGSKGLNKEDSKPKFKLGFKEYMNKSNLTSDENNSCTCLCHENKEDSKLNTSKPKFELGFQELKNRSNIANDENNSNIHLCHENKENSKLNTSEPKLELEFKELKNRSNFANDENNSSIKLGHENKEDPKLNTSKPKFEFGFKELKNRSNIANDENNSNIQLCHENKENSKPKLELGFKELKNRSNFVNDENNSSIQLGHENKEDSKLNTSKPKFEFGFKELKNRSNIANGENNSNIQLCHEDKENSKLNTSKPKLELGFKDLSVTPKSHLKPNNGMHHSPIVHSPNLQEPIMHPLQTPTKDELDPPKTSNINITADLKDSFKENENISLEELRTKLIQASSGEESLWKLMTLESNRAVFKLTFGPWLFKCVLLLYIQQENARKSSITFEIETDDDGKIDRYRDLGYKVFQHLVQEKNINFPICCDKIVLKLAEYSSIARKAEALMRDILHISFSSPLYTVCHELDLLKVSVDLLNDERQSSYRLSFSVNLSTYPNEKIVPEINHKLLNDITEKVKQAISRVEPGSNYLWNMVKAAHVV